PRSSVRSVMCVMPATPPSCWYSGVAAVVWGEDAQAIRLARVQLTVKPIASVIRFRLRSGVSCMGSAGNFMDDTLKGFLSAYAAQCRGVLADTSLSNKRVLAPMAMKRQTHMLRLLASKTSRNAFLTLAVAAACALLAPNSARAGDLLLATWGVSQVVGAGGGGLAPWATIAGSGSSNHIGGSAFVTHSITNGGHELTVTGAAVVIHDRV